MIGQAHLCGPWSTNGWTGSNSGTGVMTKDSPPCKVHAVHLCFGSSNCFRPSLTVVPSQDWEGSCLAKGAAAALQCALLFSCLRTSGAAATLFRIGSGASSGGLRVLCAKKNEVLHKSFVTNPWESSLVSSLKSPFGLGYLFENATNDIGCRRFQGW